VLISLVVSDWTGNTKGGNGAGAEVSLFLPMSMPMGECVGRTSAILLDLFCLGQRRRRYRHLLKGIEGVEVYSGRKLRSCKGQVLSIVKSVNWSGRGSSGTGKIATIDFQIIAEMTEEVKDLMPSQRSRIDITE